MKYKALMLDLDGTTIPIKPDGVPSERVKEAIVKANKKIFVGIATSRPYHAMVYLMDQLTLSSPCIINGGSEILDPISRKILSQQYIQEEDIKKVFKITQAMKLTLIVDFHDTHIEMVDTQINLHKALSGYTLAVEEKKTDEFLKRISHISTISAHKMPFSEIGKQYVSINHTSATKQHGILQVAELLQIKTSEIIAIGDGHNDLPLLLACGLKVAMRNAPDALKEIADYIAPSVEEDGVADVIEKYVL